MRPSAKKLYQTIEWIVFTNGEAEMKKNLIFLCLMFNQWENFSNDAMKSSKLLRHLRTKHLSLEGKPLAFLKRLLQEQKEQKDFIQEIMSTNEKALKASFLVANRITRSKNNLQSETK
ncbi:Protein FAM200B [Dictyocoela muelleri]|nr:Protein FAM200B [Dictyocoela muelleri]